MSRQSRERLYRYLLSIGQKEKERITRMYSMVGGKRDQAFIIFSCGCEIPQGRPIRVRANPCYRHRLQGIRG